MPEHESEPRRGEGERAHAGSRERPASAFHMPEATRAPRTEVGVHSSEQAARVESAREAAHQHATGAEAGHGDAHGHGKDPDPFVTGIKLPIFGLGMVWIKIWDTLEGWFKKIEEWGLDQQPKSWKEALGEPRKTAAEMKKKKEGGKKGKKEEKKEPEKEHKEAPKEEEHGGGGDHGGGGHH